MTMSTFQLNAQEVAVPTVTFYVASSRRQARQASSLPGLAVDFVWKQSAVDGYRRNPCLPSSLTVTRSSLGHGIGSNLGRHSTSHSQKLQNQPVNIASYPEVGEQHQLRVQQALTLLRTRSARAAVAPEEYAPHDRELTPCLDGHSINHCSSGRVRPQLTLQRGALQHHNDATTTLRVSVRLQAD